MLTRYKMIFIIIFLLLGSALVKQVNAEMNEPTAIKLTCEISATPAQNLSDGIWLTFSIQSNLNKTIRILPWHTPLEGIFSHFFTIKDKTGQLLDYQGPLMKRAAPIDSDYINLEASQKLSHRVDLSKTYTFIQKQSYLISLEDFGIEIIYMDNTRQSVDCNSNKLSISIN